MSKITVGYPEICGSQLCIPLYLNLGHFHHWLEQNDKLKWEANTERNGEHHQTSGTMDFEEEYLYSKYVLEDLIEYANWLKENAKTK